MATAKLNKTTKKVLREVDETTETIVLEISKEEARLIADLLGPTSVMDVQAHYRCDPSQVFSALLHCGLSSAPPYRLYSLTKNGLL